MTDDRPSVAIVGGGLAGLSAGIKLMEVKPQANVTLYTLGHHLGGKATSYRDDDGYTIDHGFHAISTNYRRFLDLLVRCGVDKSKTLVVDQGTLYYDEDTKTVARSGAATDARSRQDAGKMAAFFVKNLYTLYRQEDIEQFDDLCWTAWAVQHGLDEALTRKRSFRFSRDALFNWPSEVSAYITMKSMRLLGGSANYYLVDGSYGEDLIDPIVNRFRGLGGKIELFHKLVEVQHDGRRITGLRFAMPDFTLHNHGRMKWERSVRVLPERTATVADFQHLILAIPLDNLRELNPGDRTFWRAFPGIDNLRSVATLSLQVWTEKSVLPKISVCINGLDEPLPMVIDYKQVKSRYKNDDRVGSALEWVGQESQFEDLSDEQIKAMTYQSLVCVPGARPPQEAGIVHESFNRNTSNHERYLLTDPGTLKFRPRSRTAWANLFLAGDWIRNEIDVPTMEGAVCSGYTAVGELVKNL